MLSQVQSWGRQGCTGEEKQPCPYAQGFTIQRVAGFAERKASDSSFKWIAPIKFPLPFRENGMELSKWELDQNEGALLPCEAGIHPKAGLEITPEQGEEGQVGIRLRGAGRVAFSFIFLTLAKRANFNQAKGTCWGGHQHRSITFWVTFYTMSPMSWEESQVAMHY